MNQQTLSAFIWSVADLLRGDYKQSDYGKVILPFTVLRRLDCVLEPTKAAVLGRVVVRSHLFDPATFDNAAVGGCAFGGNAEFFRFAGHFLSFAMFPSRAG